MFRFVSCFIKGFRFRILGVSLSIVGIPLGMYLDFFFRGTVKWTIIFMIISFLLLTNWRNFLRLKFPAYNPMIGTVLAFQLMMLVYGILSSNLTTQLLTFHLYVIAICFAAASIPNLDGFEDFPKYVFVISMVNVLFAVGLISTGLMEASDVAHKARKALGEEFNIDPLTSSASCMYLILASLCMKKKSIIWMMLILIFDILASYVLLYNQKRTAIFMTVVGVFFWLFCKRKLTLKITPQRIRSVIFIITALTMTYFFVDFAHEQIDKFAESFYNGVLGLMGDKSANYSISVENRLRNRIETEQYISQNFNVFNYIFGGGYFIRWVDYPLYQSYLDMGIMGGVLFFLIEVIFPLVVLRKRVNADHVILGLLLTLYPMFTIFSSGHEYGPGKYIPIIILSFLYYTNNRKNGKRKTMSHLQ